MRNPVRILIAVTTGLLLLAGCSSPATQPSAAAPETTAASTPAAPVEEQSVLEACAGLASTLTEVSTKMQSAMTELAADPKKGVTALQDFQDTFTQAVADVTNPKVKAQTEKALAASEKMISTLDAGMKDPAKLADIEKVVENFQTEMTAIGEVCGG